MPTALGDAVAAARKTRGWTLREVERRTGIHNAHLSQIENGGIERPAPNILWTLSELFDELDYDSLLRLAGHAQAAQTGEARKTPLGAALRAMGDLTQEEQRTVLAFIEQLKEEEQR